MKLIKIFNLDFDIKRSNFQNISAFYSQTTKKYYLTHFDCYHKAPSNPSNPKIIPLTDVFIAKLNLQLTNLVGIDTTNYMRCDRRPYIVTFEAYHPISSYLLFKIERVCYSIEHANNVISDSFRYSAKS